MLGQDCGVFPIFDLFDGRMEGISRVEGCLSVKQLNYYFLLLVFDKY